MELLEYIKKNYKTPNVAVLRTLGASEELIEYLTNTPWNTNIKMVESLISGSGDDEKQGIKSIAISPALETMPTLDSLFPLYWDDIEMDTNRKLVLRNFEAANFLVQEYTITVTPTSEWFVADEEGTTQGKGQPVSLKGTLSSGKITFKFGVGSDTEFDDTTKSIAVQLNIASGK